MTQKEYILDHGNDYAMYAYGACMDTKRHLLLTGKAGSGKSSLIEYVVKTSKKKIMILAATNVAAQNTGGCTIHWFFSFPKGPLIVGNNNRIGKAIPKKRREKIKELDMIIIDEASLVRADMMDAIDFTLKLIRGNDLPFGGVQMVFTGDLYQLPPVMTKEDKGVILANYSSEYFFDSNAIKAIDLVKIELQKNYRQDDEEYAGILDRVRTGDHTQLDLDKLNERYTQREKFNHEYGIVLATTNDVVKKINQEAFNKLVGLERTYKAKVIGTWDSEFPLDKEIYLKEGAKVMIAKNPTYSEGYIRGRIGKVVSVRNGDVLIGDEIGERFYINQVSWKQYKIEKDDGICKRKLIGEFLQFPLKLAYAITIHKSQSLTLFTTKIDTGKGVFGSGQLYVALSRVKKLEYLFLENKIKFSDIIVDNRVKEFLKDLNDESALADLGADILKADLNILAVA